MVDSAVASLDDKQLDSCGIEIDLLSKRVADAYGVATNTHEDEQDVRGALHRIEVVADDLRGARGLRERAGRRSGHYVGRHLAEDFARPDRSAPLSRSNC